MRQHALTSFLVAAAVVLGTTIRPPTARAATVEATPADDIEALINALMPGDELILHLSDTKFTRLQSVRYPRTGKPSIITDVAVADADFQQQLAFWYPQIPGR